MATTTYEISLSGAEKGKSVVIIDYHDGEPVISMRRADGTHTAFALDSHEARQIGERLISASRTRPDRLATLRDAVQSLIGADGDDLAAALADTDPMIVSAVKNLRRAAL